MQPDFWHKRWSEGKLGFHQPKINSRLQKFWNATAPHKGERVFVPLCGKSLDMVWLAEMGHSVIGIEVSEVACRDFYIENQRQYTRKQDAPPAKFIKFAGTSIDIWCGDFFDLTPADLNDVRVVYDRASLIALPEAMRGNYVSHLAALLASGARIFLISMDYDESKMNGPPFSVSEHEVRARFEKKFSVDLITQASGPDIVGHLAERGLDTLNEKVYLLRRM